MNPLQKSALRLAIYGAVLTYLAADLFVFNGPIARKIEQANPFSVENLAAAKSRGVVARVFNHQITRGQVDRALSDRLWLSGRTAESMSPEDRRIARYAALDELIDHELLRVKAMAHAHETKVTKEGLAARMQRFKARFPNDAAMHAAMKSQGIPDETALRDRLNAHMQQENYVALKIEPLVTVSDAEAREWFEQHRDQLAHPERIRARHIFLPARNHTGPEAAQILDQALATLSQDPSQFAAIAGTISQDPASRHDGGRLGWLTRDRLDGGFADMLFKLPLNQFTIVESPIGWHLVEVIERAASTPRSYQDAEAEVIAALKAIKRREAVRSYRRALRQFEAKKITIFHEMME